MHLTYNYLVLVLCIALAACGGGSGSSASAPSTPASANNSSSVPGPTAYIAEGGLTWMPITLAAYSYGQATALCAGTIDGKSGWRLPTQPELSALFVSTGFNGEGLPAGTEVWTSSSPSAGTNYIEAYSSVVGGVIGLGIDTLSANNVTCVISAG